ncbi:lipase family protein, partial [Arthrospira platensis SPKY1]|nr:lipase family protein [Arthrospira platensis SPKY1]
VLVTESVNDGVVAPAAIAAMADQWCAAGSTLDVTWLGPLRGNADSANVESHMYEGSVGGALATTWFEQRFAGVPAGNSCGEVAPIVLPAE